MWFQLQCANLSGAKSPLPIVARLAILPQITLEEEGDEDHHAYIYSYGISVLISVGALNPGVSILGPVQTIRKAAGSRKRMTFQQKKLFSRTKSSLIICDQPPEISPVGDS